MIFNKPRTSLAGWAVGGACAALGACKVPISNPAAVCASPQTAEGLASVAFSGLRLHPGDVQIRIDSPVLNSFNATTQKRTCSANLSVAFGGSPSKAEPNKGKAMLVSNEQVGSISGPVALQALTGLQEYSIQPSADGKGLVYALSQQLVGALQALVLASKTATEQQTATASVADHSTSPSTESAAIGQNSETIDDNSLPPMFKGGSAKLLPASYDVPHDRRVHSLLAEPNVASTLQRLMGSHYSDFLACIDVAGDIEQDATGIFGEGNAQHEGGGLDAAFHIAEDGNVVIAVHNAEHNPSIMIYGANSIDELPSKIKDFIDTYK